MIKWTIGFLAVMALVVSVGCGSPKAKRTVSAENSSTNTGTPLDLPGDWVAIKERAEALLAAIEKILAKFDFDNFPDSLADMSLTDLQNILVDLRAAGVELDQLAAETQQLISEVNQRGDLEALTELEQTLTELRSSLSIVNGLIDLVSGFLG